MLPCLMQAQSLQQSIESAFQKNNGIKSANLNLKSKQENVSSAYSRYYPVLDLDANYTHLNKELLIDLNPIRSGIINLQVGDAVTQSNLESLIKNGRALTDAEVNFVKQSAFQKLDKALPAFTEKMKEQDYPQITLTLKQPLFTGGKITAGVDAAEAMVEMEQSKYEKQKQEIALEVIGSYLNVLIANENVKVRSDVVDGIKKHSDLAKRLEETGVISKHEKLRADVALAEAEVNLFEAKEKLKIAREAMLSVINADKDDFSPSDSLIFKDLKGDLNDFTKSAINNNPDLMTLRSGSKALEGKSKSEFADYFPTLFAFGTYNVLDQYLSVIEPQWAVGVGLKYNLFNGMQNYKEYASAKAEEEALVENTKEIERKINLLVKSKYMNIQLYKDMYQKLDADLSMANENVRLNEKRFNTGIGTSLELIDAELSLESIRLKRVNSLINYYKNIADLYSVTGNYEAFVKFWNN